MRCSVEGHAPPDCGPVSQKIAEQLGDDGSPLFSKAGSRFRVRPPHLNLTPLLRSQSGFRTAPDKSGSIFGRK